MKQKRTHDSQIVRAKENLKLSHGGPSYSQSPGTNPLIKALRQSQVWGLTHRRAIKEETIAINRDSVYPIKTIFKLFLGLKVHLQYGIVNQIEDTQQGIPGDISSFLDNIDAKYIATSSHKVKHSRRKGKVKNLRVLNINF